MDEKETKKLLRMFNEIGLPENYVKKMIEKQKGIGLHHLLWTEYNRLSLEYAKKHQWGLFRNIRYHMSKYLKFKGDLKESLIFLFEVIHLDANGPNNVCIIEGEPDFTFDKSFDPENFGMLAKGIIQELFKLNKILKMDNDELKALYFKYVKRMEIQPVSIEGSWELLEKGLNTTQLF